MRRLFFKANALFCALAIVFGNQCAFGSIDEIFELYNAPGALAMGNAMTADAQGYVANYYNPAGLAKSAKKNWEMQVLAFEGLFTLAAFNSFLAARSIGIHQMANQLLTEPGKYYYNRVNFIPAISSRGFGATLLGAYEFAGKSDGTTLDVHAKTDLAPSVGTAFNFLGNLVKVGVAGKAILRNELKGEFAHSAINEEVLAAQQMKSGLGLGFDVGALFTIPISILPSFGVVVKDVLGTTFRPSHVLNPVNQGVPDAIAQSINFGFSVHPPMGRRKKATIAFDIHHFERTDINILKRSHLGFQFEDERRFYFWLGMGEMYFTAGIAYRLPGGNIEFVTYGADASVSGTVSEDRRFVLRYTAGF